MIAALPLAQAATHAAGSNNLAAQAPGANNAVDSSNAPDPTAHVNDVINHHFNGIQPQDMPLPDHVTSFYTMGPNAPVQGPPPVSTSPSMSMDSAHVFEDLPRYLQEVGGPSDPAAMLAAQVQVTEATLGWTLIGQMASKAVSGMQTLFNNQV